MPIYMPIWMLLVPSHGSLSSSWQETIWMMMGICWWCCRCFIFSSFSFFSPVRDYSALNLISRWHISQSPWVISFRNPTLSHIWSSSSVWGLQLSEIISHVTVTRSSVEPVLQTPRSSGAARLSYLTGRRNFTDKQPTTWQRHEMG